MTPSPRALTLPAGLRQADKWLRSCSLLRDRASVLLLLGDEEGAGEALGRAAEMSNRAAEALSQAAVELVSPPTNQSIEERNT